MQGFCLERKGRGHGRAGGVACYIRNYLMYKRLNDMEVNDLEVMWIKVMPKKNASKILKYTGSMFILYSKDGVFENTLSFNHQH